MGIRRRRKKLSTVMTSIDRRLKHVELRRVPRIVKDGTITAVKLSADLQSIITKSEQSTDITATAGVGIVAPTFVAKPYISVIKVEYRGYNLSDTEDDLATVYFDGDPGVVAGDYMMFSGFTTFLDASGSTGVEYKVTDAGVFDGKHYARYFPGKKVVQRASLTLTKGVRIRAANVNVAGAVVDGSTTRYTLGSIVYDVGTGSNSDITYGPNWVGDPVGSGSRFTEYDYQTGDDISIDGLGAPFDGTFKVFSSSRVGDLITLQYTLSTPVVAPVPLPTTDGAIRAAGARLIRNGETYTDTSSGSAITYIWDDALNKWWNPADPALPEGVVVDDGIAPSPPTAVSGTSTGYASDGPKAKVVLNWTAPTTNAGGTPLSDLRGYKIYYKLTSQTGDYAFAADTGAAATGTVLGLTAETSYTFVVTAYDKSKRESLYSTAYTITTAKGALDLDVPSAPVLTSRLGVITVKWDGNNSAGISMSGSTTLTVLEMHRSTTTGFTPSATTLIAIVPRSAPTYVDASVEYVTNYYYKLIAKDVFDNKSTASAQSVTQVKPLVDTDLVEATLTTWPFNGKVVSASALADGSVSGSTLISGTPQDGVWALGALAAGSIAANDMAANSIIAGKIAAETITATEIATDAITADKILANAITTDKIEAGAVTTQKLTAGELIGFAIKTSDTGQRVEITGADNFIRFYNSSGAYAGHISGTTNLSGYTTIELAYGDVTTGSGTYGGYIQATSEGLDLISRQYNVFTGFQDIAYVDITSGVFIAAMTSDSITLNASGSFSSVSISGDDGIFIGDAALANSTLYTPAGYLTANVVTTVPNVRMASTGELVRTSHANSSRRFKNDIREYSFDVDRYLAIDPVVFKYKPEFVSEASAGQDVYGFIAEDFADAGFDFLLTYNKKGEVEELDYIKLVVLLHGVAKQQDERIKALEAIVNSK